METVQLSIEGMHCDGCVNSITKALKALSGVGEVEVSLEQKRATISYDPAQCGDAELKGAIEDAGFDVV